MKKVSRLDYTYAVGRVRALEKFLIPKTVFSSAAEEKTVHSALKVIFDAGRFSEEKTDMKLTQNLDDFVAREKEVLAKTAGELMIEENFKKILAVDTSLVEALRCAEEAGNPFILDYLRARIDLGNLKVFLRAKFSGFSKQICEEWMMEGGRVDVRQYLKNFDISLSECEDIHKVSPYNEIWCRAVDALMHRESFVELERGIEDYLMNFLRRAKTVVFGPEPVFAYALAKRKELELIRLVGVGKINGISPKTLQERISETFV